MCCTSLPHPLIPNTASMPPPVAAQQFASHCPCPQLVKQISGDHDGVGWDAEDILRGDLRRGGEACFAAPRAAEGTFWQHVTSLQHPGGEQDPCKASSEVWVLQSHCGAGKFPLLQNLMCWVRLIGHVWSWAGATHRASAQIKAQINAQINMTLLT